MSDETGGLPAGAVEMKFLAATGPGGQNVNKVATACQLRVDLTRLGLSPETYRRARALGGSRVAEGGVLVITARRFRTQEANRRDAFERVAALLAQARLREAPRRATRPTRASVTRRVEGKKGRSAVKAGRARPRID
jgi:ribosome-associated protein